MGIAKDSFISTLLEDYESEGKKNEEHEEDITALGGVIFLGEYRVALGTISKRLLILLYRWCRNSTLYRLFLLSALA